MIYMILRLGWHNLARQKLKNSDNTIAFGKDELTL